MSGGSSASSRSIELLRAASTSASLMNALVTRSAQLARDGSASCAPSANRSRWICSERRVEVGDRARDARDEAEPGVQLVDLAVGVDARSALLTRVPAEERRLAGIAGARVDFHGRPAELYEMPAKRKPTAAAPRSTPPPRARRRRSPAVPPAAAHVVPAPRPRPAVAQDRRPVPHPRLGDHAAADAGRSRAAEVRRVAGQVSVAARARRRARSRRHRRPGIRSATTSVPGGCRRSRARRSRGTTASCRPTRRRCCRSRASARTRPARSAASRSAQRAAILDTNVARVLFRVFVGKGDPKSHAMKRHLWAVSEALVPAAARLRLQPGADGLRRDGLRRAKSEVPGLPDGEGLPVRIRSRRHATE